VLEIGVWHGESTSMWAEYFPLGKIVGVDIDFETLRYEEERITIEIADQSSVSDLVNLGRKHGPFDLVVDDGSHVWHHQITTLRWLFPFVKPGRYYILEDIDTSYGTHAPSYRGISQLSAAQYLQRLADYMIADAVLDIALEEDAFVRSYARRLEFIAFSRRTSVIRLKP
jgi:cephalosporin hydroxylase